jgi:hypothetical protein
MSVTNEDAVFEAVRSLVDVGEYRDEIPGVPGARLSGGGAFRRPSPRRHLPPAGGYGIAVSQSEDPTAGWFRYEFQSASPANR